MPRCPALLIKCPGVPRLRYPNGHLELHQPWPFQFPPMALFPSPPPHFILEFTVPVTPKHTTCVLWEHMQCGSQSAATVPQVPPELGCGHSRLQYDTLSGSCVANVMWFFSLMAKPGSETVQSNQFAIISCFPHTTGRCSHGRPGVRNPETWLSPHKPSAALGFTQHLQVTL